MCCRLVGEFEGATPVQFLVSFCRSRGFNFIELVLACLFILLLVVEVGSPGTCLKAKHNLWHTPAWQHRSTCVTPTHRLSGGTKTAQPSASPSGHFNPCLRRFWPAHSLPASSCCHKHDWYIFCNSVQLLQTWSEDSLYCKK